MWLWIMGVIPRRSSVLRRPHGPANRISVLDPVRCPPPTLCSKCFVWCYGAKFTGQMMDLWAYRNGVKIDFSRPGKPTDNAFCESFNGTFRSERLDTDWFSNLEDARQLIEAWRRE